MPEEPSLTPIPSPLSLSTPSLPSPLPARYEIRLLTPASHLHAAALIAHSNLFHNPIHRAADPNDPTTGLHAAILASEYLVSHQLNSGLSLGVFDLLWTPANPLTTTPDGTFHWDPTDAAVSSQSLLDQMDFPLVSVALAHDQIDAKDARRMRPIMAAYPRLGLGGEEMARQDPRRKGSWEASGRGQVVVRNATATRRDYEGRGLMKGLARFQMAWVRAKGFRGIEIGSVSDAVSWVWENPEPPARSTVVGEFRTWEFGGRDREGRNPLGDRRGTVKRIWVELN